MEGEIRENKQKERVRKARQRTRRDFEVCCRMCFEGAYTHTHTHK